MSRKAGALCLIVILAVLFFVAAEQNHWSPFAMLRGLSSDSPEARARLTSSEASEQDSGPPAESDTPAVEQSDYLSFPHRTDIDPLPDKVFVVSFRFSVAVWPPRQPDRRVRLVSKFGSRSNPPFPGWVIAIRPGKTSVRPEVFWQTPAGHGGWFSFDRIEVKRDTQYDATLIVRAEQQMSFFLKEVPQEAADGGSGSPSADSSNAPVLSTDAAADVPANYAADGFLGGYALQGTGFPRSEEDLFFASSPASATVSRLVIAQVENLRLSRRILSALVRRGPDGVLESLKPAEITLSYPPDKPRPIGAGGATNASGAIARASQASAPAVESGESKSAPPGPSAEVRAAEVRAAEVRAAPNGNRAATNGAAASGPSSGALSVPAAERKKNAQVAKKSNAVKKPGKSGKK